MPDEIADIRLIFLGPNAFVRHLHFALFGWMPEAIRRVSGKTLQRTPTLSS